MTDYEHGWANELARFEPLVEEVENTPGMKPCPDCYDGEACLPGGCGIDDCPWCGKPCPTCGGSCEVAIG